MGIGGPFGPANPIGNLIEELRRNGKAGARSILTGLAGGNSRLAHTSIKGAMPIVPNPSSTGFQFGGAVTDALSRFGQQQDPTTSLYEQLLEQLQSPVAQPAPVDPSAIMRQVQSAINPIYDQRISAAQGNTKRATTDVKNMYGALSDDYEKLAPQQVAQAADAQKQIEGLYGQLRSNIEGNYSRVSSDQAELFKSLGIESALPDVLAEQNPAVNDALTAASENQAQQQQRYLDQGQIDSTYYREGAPIATMAGNEISTDMLSQLSNYVNQANAERTAGIQSGYMDQLGQAQSAYNSQQQTAASETARRQEMLMQLLNQQMQAQSKSSSAQLDPSSYLSSLSPDLQNSTASAFTQLQRSPESVYGKTEDPRNPVPGSFVETTPEWYLQQADQMYQSGQIDDSTHQALMMYIQLYYGLGQGK